MFGFGVDQPRVTLGHIGPVPVRLELTFLLVPLFYIGDLTRVATPQSMALVLLSIAGIFASILFHELGHGAVARRYGMHVRELVVGGFYGYASIAGIAPTRRAAIAVLFAGPFANLVLFAWLWGLLGFPEVTWRGDVLYDQTASTAIYHTPILAMAARRLAELNLVLFALNLLPAFPLDGGRIYRLILSHVMPQADGVRIISSLGMLVGGYFALSGLQGNMVMGLIGLQVAMLNYAIFQHPAQGEMD